MLRRAVVGFRAQTHAARKLLAVFESEAAVTRDLYRGWAQHLAALELTHQDARSCLAAESRADGANGANGANGAHGQPLRPA